MLGIEPAPADFLELFILGLEVLDFLLELLGVILEYLAVFLEALVAAVLLLCLRFKAVDFLGVLFLELFFLAEESFVCAISSAFLKPCL